jgi:aspartate carbamoyltransferase catalytic subunit
VAGPATCGAGSLARQFPLLQGRLVTILFFEPSTRTRSSFELADNTTGEGEAAGVHT